MAIATAAEVARILGCSALDASMLQLMDAAQGAMETYCDRKFDSAQRTEYHSGRGENFIYLKNAPITDSAGAVTRTTSNLSVWDDLDREWAAVDKIDDDDLVIENPEAGLLVYEDSKFSDGIQNVKVTYYGGFTAATMPEDIKQAFIILVQEWWIHRGYRTDRTGGRGPLDYPATPTEGSLPEQVRDLLSPWRRTAYATGWESDA